MTVNISWKSERQPKVAPLVGKRSLIDCYIHNQRVQGLWESGSQVTIIDALWRKNALVRYETSWHFRNPGHCRHTRHSGSKWGEHYARRTETTFRLVSGKDASDNGLGAVLYQEQVEKLHVTAYASCTLTKAKKNYHLHSGKLEFLTLKWAVTERFRDCLNGSSCTAYTDNNPLIYVFSTAKLNVAGCRWVTELVDFHLKR